MNPLPGVKTRREVLSLDRKRHHSCRISRRETEMTNDLLKREINRPVEGLGFQGESGVLKVNEKIGICRR